MRISSALAIGVMSSLVTMAPGMMQSGFASGSAFEQKKATAEQEAYKAMSLGGTADVMGGVMAPVAPVASPKMWPGVPGMAAPAPIVPWESMYVAPRGGREY